MGKSISKVGEKSVYEGKLFTVLHQDFEFENNGKKGSFTAEVAVRAPGVRIMVVRNGKILLSKEYRSELERFDYRLPGGKVFDSLSEFLVVREHPDDLLKAIEVTVKREAHEEVGILPHTWSLLQKSVCGASVEWDLYYFIIEDFEEVERDEVDSEIIYPEWKTFDEVKKMCLDGSIDENRTVAVLLKYLLCR